MGKIKYLKDVREFFKQTPVVTSRDIRLIVKNDNYAHLLIRNMIKKGEIKRIKKGYYTIHEDPTLSVFCFKPAYIGLQSVLSIHDLWEQETNVVVVTAKEVRIGVREVFGNNIILHRIKPSLLFGYDLVKYDDFYIPVSDLEKTLIDFVYFNEIPDDRVIENIRRNIDMEKLMKYLEAYSNRVKKKILKTLGKS